jgi:curved DNA-binding protein CbpA
MPPAPKPHTQFKGYIVNHYTVLGLESLASRDAVHKAYKELAKTAHPDVCPRDQRQQAEERFKRITQAYAVLNDVTQKETYDAELARVLEGVRQHVKEYRIKHGLNDDGISTDAGINHRVENRVETLEDERDGIRRSAGLERPEIVEPGAGRNIAP